MSDTVTGKYLSKAAEEILMQLDSEWCTGYKGLDGGKSIENVAAIKELKEHDMLEFHRGLMTEDGEVAGSGWCKSSKANDYLEEFEL